MEKHTYVHSVEHICESLSPCEASTALGCYIDYIKLGILVCWVYYSGYTSILGILYNVYVLAGGWPYMRRAQDGRHEMATTNPTTADTNDDDQMVINVQWKKCVCYIWNFTSGQYHCKLFNEMGWVCAAVPGGGGWIFSAEAAFPLLHNSAWESLAAHRSHQVHCMPVLLGGQLPTF